MAASFSGDVEAIQRIDAIDSILQVVTASTGMGYAAVARVTDSAWIACEVLDNIHFGLEPGGELPLESTICHEVRNMRAEVVIDDVVSDPVYRDHHTPATYGFRSYISVPIILDDGEFFGTLCAIDPEPRVLKETAVLRMFRLFAELIGFHLAANRRIASSEGSLEASQAELAAAVSLGELREQFIAVLGHDLRNPIASFDAGLGMLSKGETDPKRIRILRLLGESASRMHRLVDNLMDFARGRLGGGIGLNVKRGARIEPLLAQIVNEIRAAHPDRTLEIDFNLHHAIDVDADRIGQMLSNLLGNAITHGSPDEPITVSAIVFEDNFELTVSNGGAAISPEIVGNLFEPFQRGKADGSQEGLGLGLYIASEIAKAHGGGIHVTSTDDVTRFIFRMPVQSTIG